MTVLLTTVCVLAIQPPCRLNRRKSLLGGVGEHNSTHTFGWKATSGLWTLPRSWSCRTSLGVVSYPVIASNWTPNKVQASCRGCGISICADVLRRGLRGHLRNCMHPETSEPIIATEKSCGHCVVLKHRASRHSVRMYKLCETSSNKLDNLLCKFGFSWVRIIWTFDSTTFYICPYV
jgi:hypothetical protein